MRFISLALANEFYRVVLLAERNAGKLRKKMNDILNEFIAVFMEVDFYKYL